MASYGSVKHVKLLSAEGIKESLVEAIQYQQTQRMVLGAACKIIEAKWIGKKVNRRLADQIRQDLGEDWTVFYRDEKGYTRQIEVSGPKIPRGYSKVYVDLSETQTGIATDRVASRITERIERGDKQEQVFRSNLDKVDSLVTEWNEALQKLKDISSRAEAQGLMYQIDLK